VDPISRQFIRVVRQRAENQPEAVLRSRLILLEGYVSIVLNAILAVVKGAIGWLSGSIALLADAVHTLADCITSIVLVVGAYISRMPADREHPFGHGRVEHIVTIVIGMLLGVAAFEFGLESASRILNPAAVDAPNWALIAVAGTVLIKLWNSFFAKALAAETGSQAVEADFWHHMTDVWATLLALIGMLSGRFGLHALDGWMGLGVSAILFWVAWKIIRGASDPLMGLAPTQDELDEVRKLAMSVPEVRDIHDVVMHRYGELKLISLHAEVSAALTAWQAHNVAERVQQEVSQGRHGSVTVHVDPVNDAHPCYEKVKQLLEEIVAQTDEVETFHDLRLIGEQDSFAVVFDVTTREERSAELEAKLDHYFSERLRAAIDRIVSVSVNIEPPYTFTAHPEER